MQKESWILTVIVILALLGLFSQVLPKVTEQLEKAAKAGSSQAVVWRQK